MERSRISSRGQILIPQRIRDCHGWKRGAELWVTEDGDGVRIESVHQVQQSKTLAADDVFGCLRHKGKTMPISRLAARVKLGKTEFR